MTVSDLFWFATVFINPKAKKQLILRIYIILLYLYFICYFICFLKNEEPYILHFLIFLASNPHGIEAFQDGFDFFVV